MTTEPILDVATVGGVVRGRHEDGLAVFRGIPFAEPPVGRLRFAAPQPVRRWEGTREAFAFGPPPPQEPLSPAIPTPTPGGEDWLTVNVWTPDPDPAAKRPVMVWIYGGAYKFGTRSGDGHRVLAGDAALGEVALCRVQWLAMNALRRVRANCG